MANVRLVFCSDWCFSEQAVKTGFRFWTTCLFSQATVASWSELNNDSTSEQDTIQTSFHFKQCILSGLIIWTSVSETFHELDCSGKNTVFSQCHRVDHRSSEQAIQNSVLFWTTCDLQTDHLNKLLIISSYCFPFWAMCCQWICHLNQLFRIAFLLFATSCSD